jgi:Transposase DDE domain group 1
VIKSGKDLGLRRLPSYSFAFNQAWCIAVAIAADLLAWLRHLALDHHPQLSRATPAILRRDLLNVPARLVRRARKRIIRVCDDHPYVCTEKRFNQPGLGCPPIPTGRTGWCWT